MAITIVVVLLLIAALWVAFRALTVKNELEAAQAVVAQVQNDQAEIKDAVGALSSHAQKAADAAGDPVWNAFEILPFLGDNLRGVRLAAQSLDVVANDLGVPALAEFDADSDEPVLARILPVLTAAEPEVTRLAEEITAVQSSSSLIGPVRGGVDQVGEVMQAAAPMLALVPELLGAEGERNYLLTFQNNAESVGLGGSAASQTMLNANQGAIAITGQASSTQYANKTAVDVDVPQSALDLYSNYLIDHINTSASRPDFPTMANIVRAFWQRDIADQQVDGVLSIDPIALSRILRATGPIQLATGDELTETNAVDLLLNGVYLRWGDYSESRLVDAFFASAASTIFEKVATGDFDPKDMMWAIGEGIDNGNILFWSAHEEIQKQIEPLRVSGILPTENDAATTVGVFFRDESMSKIDYYMESGIKLAEACADGRRTFTTSTTLRMDIDQAAADQLPAYVRSGHWGSSQFRTQVYVYGPPGTTLESVSVEGRDVAVTRQDIQDLERPVAWFTTNLAPMEQATVTAVFSAEDGEFGPLELRSTPMINTTAYALDTSGCADR
ncbi:DUF4012 domain-containing protein [Microbacterium phosphatis]|uniref:DUF4012 domain-containing protein n=1 Tax=Microbacterium phosphatis TaxID=3140248 RepID=UPI00314060B7